MEQTDIYWRAKNFSLQKMIPSREPTLNERLAFSMYLDFFASQFLEDFDYLFVLLPSGLMSKVRGSQITTLVLGSGGRVFQDRVGKCDDGHFFCGCSII